MAVPVYQHAPNQWARWGADEELQELRSQLLRLSGGDLSSVLGGAFTPPADIEETDDAYVVSAELPGIRREDIDLELVGNELTISGEVKDEKHEGTMRRQTRRRGRFDYRVSLPDQVDANKVSANLKDGVLEVRVPRAQKAARKKISVKTQT